MQCDFNTVEHRRGVAGGGWEDEDDTHCDTAANVHPAQCTVSSSSAASIDSDRLRTLEPLHRLCPLFIVSSIC